METSKSVEALAERVMRSFKRAKARKGNSLRTTRYANLINDLLQRENPRRDFMGDFVGVLAGLRECNVSRADALDIRDSISGVFDELWGEVEKPMCPKLAHIVEETVEANKDVAEAHLIFFPSGPNAEAFLTVEREYDEARKPLRKYAESILGGSAA